MSRKSKKNVKKCQKMVKKGPFLRKTLMRYQGKIEGPKNPKKTVFFEFF